jgi:hypothetical protein
MGISATKRSASRLLVCEVDMPNPVTYLNQAPKFEWFVIRCGSKEQIPKTQLFQKDWTTYSKYVNHSNSQRKWVRLYDHLMRT